MSVIVVGASWSLRTKSNSIPVSVASDVTSDPSPSRVVAQWLDVDLYAVWLEGLCGAKNLRTECGCIKVWAEVKLK